MVDPARLQDPALASALARIEGDARRALPEVSLAPGLFAAQVAAHLPGDDPEREIAALHGTDLFLACACVHGDAAAVARLDRALSNEVARALNPMRFSASEADDVRLDV